jgi:hypothetical protein
MAAIFKTRLEVLFIAAGHTAAMWALCEIPKQSCRIKRLAITEEDWRPKPFAAISMQATDFNAYSFSHNSPLSSNAQAQPLECRPTGGT